MGIARQYCNIVGRLSRAALLLRYLLGRVYPVIYGLFPIESSILIQVVPLMPLSVRFTGASCIANLFGFSMFWGTFVVYELCARLSASVGVPDSSRTAHIVPRRGHAPIFLRQLLYIPVCWLSRNSA